MSKPKIIVRVEKSGEYAGTVLGVYATETEQYGSYPAVGKYDGHFNIDPAWYKNSTRPATAEEEQEFTTWYEPNYSECELVKRRSAKR